VRSTAYGRQPRETRVSDSTRHRISIYDGVDWGELYDLQEDPDETANLWNEPGATRLRGELMERLAKARLAGAETSPYPSARA
jgi:hypothetical protein